MRGADVRYVSGKIFGNQKFVEVVLALAEESGVATAKQLATRTGVDHSLVRDVMIKLADAGIVTTVPRAHTRAPQYYEVQPRDLVWQALRVLAEMIANQYGASAADPRQSARLGPSTGE